MSNKPSQEEINNYLQIREQYKQNYLAKRQQNINMKLLYVEQQNYINKQNFKNRVLTDLYLGNPKSLKRRFNFDPKQTQMIMQVLKKIN
jgi:hypothetical protein